MDTIRKLLADHDNEDPDLTNTNIFDQANIQAARKAQDEEAALRERFDMDLIPRLADNFDMLEAYIHSAEVSSFEISMLNVFLFEDRHVADVLIPCLQPTSECFRDMLRTHENNEDDLVKRFEDLLTFPPDLGIHRNNYNSDIQFAVAWHIERIEWNKDFAQHQRTIVREEMVSRVFGERRTNQLIRVEDLMQDDHRGSSTLDHKLDMDRKRKKKHH